MRFERRFLHRYLSEKDQHWAERVEKMRQDFVANVSHELRTPLTVIIGFMETILDQNPPELAAWRDILQQVHQQGQRMESLVNDLLLLSRLETTPFQENAYEPVDVVSLLEQIQRDAKTLSGERGHEITLTCDTEEGLLGFENELRSAFSNIIYNAVNYTPAKGKIVILWTEQDDQLCLSVKDTGLGIAEEHIPRLTERFYRVDTARSREQGGTGLGLAIVKHVLMRNHGRLLIDSELGQGSEFTCVFEKTVRLR